MNILKTLSWLALALVIACAPTPTDPDALLVAAPTGDVETDRAAVQAALDQVEPGGTVQLAAGTYLLGGGVELRVPDVTLQGDPDGTVLRGCDPEALAFPAPPEQPDPLAIIQRCSGLFLIADRQTVRDLTIEYAWHGIFVGAPPWAAQADDETSAPPQGGHTIENNLFRYMPNGIRVVGPASEPTVIRDNEVLNAYHAFQANGTAVHFLNNTIRVPEPHQVPVSYYPESGIIISQWDDEGHTCEGSRVEGNLIEGTMHGIHVLADPGQTCRDHVIRDNEIRLGEIPLAEDYPDHLRAMFFGSDAVGTAATGTAIRLYGGAVTDVLVENNTIVGGFGLGIQLQQASNNRLIGNRISGIQKRDPFPGLTWGEDATVWEEANGSGIWLSVGSDENLLEGNVIENAATTPVTDEGQANTIR